MVEHWFCKPTVVGSIPTAGSNFWDHVLIISPIVKARSPAGITARGASRQRATLFKTMDAEKLKEMFAIFNRPARQPARRPCERGGGHDCLPIHPSLYSSAMVETKFKDFDAAYKNGNGNKD